MRLRSTEGLVSTLAVRTLLPLAASCAKDPRAVGSRQIHPSNMQWPWIELLLRSHDLYACVIAHASCLLVT